MTKFSGEVALKRHWRLVRHSNQPRFNFPELPRRWKLGLVWPWNLHNRWSGIARTANSSGIALELLWNRPLPDYKWLIRIVLLWFCTSYGFLKDSWCVYTWFLITGWWMWKVAAAKQLLNQKNTHTDGVRERERVTHTHTHTHTHTEAVISRDHRDFEKGHQRRRGDKGSVRNQHPSFSLNPWTWCDPAKPAHTSSFKSDSSRFINISPKTALELHWRPHRPPVLPYKFTGSIGYCSESAL